MQALYAAGQLDFVNGGWCMHDVAAAHYVDMIDQTTLGHRFLKSKARWCRGGASVIAVCGALCAAVCAP